MEYCITVLVETFEPGPNFRLPVPVQTSWGEAWRSGEEGRSFWDGGLYVGRAVPQPFLISRLPQTLQSVLWQALYIDGDGLYDFESCVNRTVNVADDVADLNQHPLLSLFQELLSNQRRWAVFFLYNCDDIAHDYQQPLGALPPIVIDAYRWSSDEPRGFCCAYGAQP